MNTYQHELAPWPQFIPFADYCKQHGWQYRRDWLPEMEDGSGGFWVGSIIRTAPAGTQHVFATIDIPNHTASQPNNIELWALIIELGNQELQRHTDNALANVQ